MKYQYPISKKMPTETEHKYLINIKAWKSIKPYKSFKIKQAYLNNEPYKTIRIRIANNKGFITIKGIAKGSTRPEFEYEIPVKEADELINLCCTNIIEKVRHLVIHDNKKWEVDEFKGLNKGLFIAEIELANENEKYSIPDWVEQNVTKDQRYANSNLIAKPFSTW